MIGQAVFHAISAAFAAHERPAYVSYTMRRSQETPDGLPDLEWSYTYRVWARTSDDAAMERRVFGGRDGRLEFTRAVFNEACDPGPPTADIFNLPPLGSPPPAKTEPEALKTIASVRATSRPVYDVVFMEQKNNVWHLRVRPRYAPKRYRLRELWADATTYQLQKAVVTDELFTEGGPVYDQLDTLTFAMLNGRPVIVRIHARADFNDDTPPDGVDIDYDFSEISFPAVLPQWFFEPRLYGAHVGDAPA
jgi:hypothetical protein